MLKNRQLYIWSKCNIVSHLAYVVTFLNQNAKENVVNTIILPLLWSTYSVSAMSGIILYRKKTKKE